MESKFANDKVALKEIYFLNFGWHVALYCKRKIPTYVGQGLCIFFKKNVNLQNYLDHALQLYKIRQKQSMKPKWFILVLLYLPSSVHQCILALNEEPKQEARLLLQSRSRHGKEFQQVVQQFKEHQNETKSWVSEKINNIGKPQAKLTKRRMEKT
jgi:hypothetical protein